MCIHFDLGTFKFHYSDVRIGEIAPQITSLTIVYSTVYSDVDQRKRQSSASLAFVWGIHRGPVNSPHKGPVTQKMFPFDDVIMCRNRLTFMLGMAWHGTDHTHNLMITRFLTDIGITNLHNCSFVDFIFFSNMHKNTYMKMASMHIQNYKFHDMYITITLLFTNTYEELDSRRRYLRYG